MKRLFFLLVGGVILYSCFEIFGTEGNYQRFKAKLSPRTLDAACTSIHQALFKEDPNGTNATWAEIVGATFTWDLHVVRIRDAGKEGVMVEATCIPKSSTEGFDLVVRFPEDRKTEVLPLKPGEDVRIRGMIYKRMSGLIFADAT